MKIFPTLLALLLLGTSASAQGQSLFEANDDYLGCSTTGIIEKAGHDNGDDTNQGIFDNELSCGAGTTSVTMSNLEADNAMSYSAADDDVFTPGAGEDVSVVVFVRPETLTTGMYLGPGQWGETNGGQQSYTLRTSNTTATTLEFKIRSAGVNATVALASALSDGTPACIAAVFDNSANEMCVSVDGGTPSCNTDQTGDPQNATVGFKIGGRNGAGEEFDGNMGRAAVWFDYELTAANITAVCGEVPTSIAAMATTVGTNPTFAYDLEADALADFGGQNLTANNSPTYEAIDWPN